MSRTALILSLSALALALSAPSSPAAAGPLGSLYSCDAAGSANTGGAVIGGLLGGIAGNQIVKDNKTIATVLGAGLGSALGNHIGCKMDQKARLDAQQAFQKALETGKPQNWSDPVSGTKGRIEVLGPGSGAPPPPPPPTAPAPWSYGEGVTVARPITSTGAGFTVASRLNVRAGPNTKSEVVHQFSPGDTFWSPGAVTGGWLAVESNGQVRGYVSRGLVKPAEGVAGPNGPTPPPPQQHFDCRRVLQTISEQNQPSVSQTYNACRDGNGSWNLTAA